MESSIAEFLMRWLACELPPTSCRKKRAKNGRLSLKVWQACGDMVASGLASSVAITGSQTVTAKVPGHVFEIARVDYHSVHFITHQSFAFY